MPTSIQVSLVCPNCQGQVISFFDTKNGYHEGECLNCGRRFTEEEIEELDGSDEGGN